MTERDKQTIAARKIVLFRDASEPPNTVKGSKVFYITDTIGYPLEMAQAQMQRAGYFTDWSGYFHSAVDAGHDARSTFNKMIEVVKDSVDEFLRDLMEEMMYRVTYMVLIAHRPLACESGLWEHGE